MRQSLHNYCVEHEKPNLLAQWDEARNRPLTPEAVPYGSNRKVWWRCGKGHVWQAAVKSRVSGTGCPVCAGKLVVPGENDLASLCPDLAKEWDGEKNAPLRPKDVPTGTSKKVWWRCEKGHGWQASVSSRVRGDGCPICAGKVIVAGENDLATAYPDIAAQWHPTKNGALTPENCAPASNRKVWWRCEKGHEYQAAVGARTVRGSGCPYCAGTKVLRGFNDLATVMPALAAQWHPTLNGALTPEMVTSGSHRRAWWVCSEGHVWQAVIHSRAGKQKCGCPVCAGMTKRAHLARVRPAAAPAAAERTPYAPLSQP